MKISNKRTANSINMEAGPPREAGQDVPKRFKIQRGKTSG
jgi:hypothetical protein